MWYNSSKNLPLHPVNLPLSPLLSMPHLLTWVCSQLSSILLLIINKESMIIRMMTTRCSKRSCMSGKTLKNKIEYNRRYQKQMKNKYMYVCLDRYTYTHRLQDHKVSYHIMRRRTLLKYLRKKMIWNFKNKN